jgi:mono/diheme cytochrome c family protein
MKMNLKIRKEYFVIFLGLLFASCLTNVEEPIIEEDIPDVVVDPCESITYSSNVKQIIDNNCTQCHSSSGGQFPNLENHSGLSANASSVKSQVESRQMPIGGSLTSAEIEAIACWVNAGAQNN